MRALVWIAEGSWQAAVDRARELLHPDTEVSILHVSPGDVEELAAGSAARLLGRHPPPPDEPPLRAIAEEEARALLEAAVQRLGRPAEVVIRHGRIEREVLELCAGFDVLVLARDGRRHHLGPKSLGHRTRFVVDHAPCDVLVAWAEEPPGPESIKWPPHLR